MTEDDARRVAVSLLNSRYPEFAAGEWVISGVADYDTAWAFSYNSRTFLDAGEVTHALAGNGALVVPKSGDEPWFTRSGADTASQIARGRSAFETLRQRPDLSWMVRGSAGADVSGRHGRVRIVSVPSEWQATTRLSLRPPTPVDAPAVLRILSDDSVVRYNPSDRVEELAEVEAVLQRWLEHWSHHDFGNCCVFERETGRLIGNCGVRRMTVHAAPVLNLMYRFHPSAWGRGYATEAALAVLDWASRSLPGEIVLARVRPENAASQAVVRRIGLRRDPLFDDQGKDGLDWAFTSRPQ